MSLKFVLNYLISKIEDSFTTIYNRVHIVETLQKTKFYEISELLPDEYFLLEFEPLYAFMKKIQQDDRVYRTDNISYILDHLFKEKIIGKQKLFFSDFTGVTDSTDPGMCSFPTFKDYQYKKNKISNIYKDYYSLRHDVFDIDRYGSCEYIESAIRLNWSNLLYARNRDRSHRFATLCKWNEIENHHDSVFLEVKEISINEEMKKRFLENYDGFLLHAKTLADIITNRNIVHKFYHSFVKFNSNENKDIGYLIINKEDINDEIRNVFLSEKKCIYINLLLEKQANS